MARKSYDVRLVGRCRGFWLAGGRRGDCGGCRGRARFHHSRLVRTTCGKPMAKPASPAISANTRMNDLFMRRPAPLTIMGQADSVGKAGRYLYCAKKREEAERGTDSNRDANS